jgi:hypothetical protein
MFIGTPMSVACDHRLRRVQREAHDRTDWIATALATSRDRVNS